MFTREARRTGSALKWRVKKMTGYVLMLLGSTAVLSAFLFRTPIYIGIKPALR